MKLTIEITMDNAAFGEDGESRAWEVRRILGRVNGLLDNLDAGYERSLFDVNGNRVGKATVSD